MTAAQAERELRLIGIRARRDARWAAFTGTHPDVAATIDTDCAAWDARAGEAMRGQSAAHEVRSQIRQGRAWAAQNYMARRARFSWTS
jgi:hypothetical protein